MAKFYARLQKAREAGGSAEGPELQACVKNTVASLQSMATDAQRPGMLLGKIQSGKTRAFLGVIAAAFDEGFDVAVVLTKGTKTLAKQTVNRIGKEFAVFRDAEELAVYDIMTMPELTPYEIEDNRLVIVAKKEHNNMRRLVALFRDTPALRSKRVLIVDDEADFASIRFVKQKGASDFEQGRIADQIDELRRELSNPAVLQVTATPYALYLQPEDYPATPGQNYTFEPKRPAFTQLVPIHSGYVGGEHYFGDHMPDEPEYYLWHPVTPDELTVLKKEDRRRFKAADALISDKVAGLRHAIVTFVTAAVIRRLQQREAGEPVKKYALIMHVETARSAHQWQHQVAGEIKEALARAAKATSADYVRLVDEAIQDLTRSIEAGGYVMPARQTILDEVANAFRREAVVTERVNSDNDVEKLLDENAELRLRTPFNVFIGGQILDRGITVPNLLGFYYGRSPKKMQQDTVLQHARMYGNRPKADLAVTRFYTTPGNFMALKAIHEFDSALRHAFESGSHSRGVAFIAKDSANRIIPCAPGKIAMSNLVSIKPGGTLVPFGFQTKSKTSITKTVERIEAMIPPGAFGDGAPVLLPAQQAVSILSAIEQTLVFEEGYPFDWNGMKAAIEYFAGIIGNQGEKDQCGIFVESGRSLSRIREGGRYSDSPHTYQDRDRARQIEGSHPTLALLKQEGRETDGWRDVPFWWPVLFAPLRATPTIFSASISESADGDDDEDE